MKQLIELGADVNSRTHDGRNTPLLTVAVLRKFERIVHLLASAPGVDINAEDNDGFTALYYAVRINVIKIAKILLESGAALNTRPDRSLGSLLTWARIMKNVEMVGLLLKHGAKPDILNTVDGWSNFHHAVYHGCCRSSHRVWRRR